ncbi:hypothetical protein Dimus_020785 [Dionaea muscipula]
MGTAEEDLRLDFPDFSGVVVQEEDLSPIMVLEPDLKASIDGCSLTKAKELDDQSIAPPVASGSCGGSGFALVSVPASSRCAGSLEVAVEDRGCDPILGMLPEVSAHSDSGGDQAMGNDVDGLITPTAVGDDAPCRSFMMVLSSEVEGERGRRGFAGGKGGIEAFAIDGREATTPVAVEPVMVAERGGSAPGAGRIAVRR